MPKGCHPLRGLVCLICRDLGFRSLRSLHPRLYADVRFADLEAVRSAHWIHEDKRQQNLQLLTHVCGANVLRAKLKSRK